jgi:hypothetical protein
MGTRSLSRGLKWLGVWRGPLIPEVKERVGLHLFPLWAFMAPPRVNFFVTLMKVVYISFEKQSG